jgi:hypothetical protein
MTKRRTDGPSDAERWRGLLSPILAGDQISWEWRHALLRAYEAGASLGVLANHENVTAKHILNRIYQARRERERHTLSPAERWMRSGAADLCAVEMARRVCLQGNREWRYPPRIARVAA